MSITKSNLNYHQSVSDTFHEFKTPKSNLLKSNHLGYSTFYENKRQISVNNLKSGWLKRKATNKLFSSKTSWQLRWVEFCKDSLLFYQSDESKAPQQVAHLSHTDLPLLLPLDTFKLNDKTETLYPFQLFIDNNEQKKEEEILAADSEEERTSWMRNIKCSLFGHLGGGIFGQKLEITLEIERKKNQNQEIPELVETCIQFIRKYGLNKEGLFRLTGRSSKLRLLEEMYDIGRRPTLHPISSSIIQTNHPSTLEPLNILKEDKDTFLNDPAADSKMDHNDTVFRENIHNSDLLNSKDGECLKDRRINSDLSDDDGEVPLKDLSNGAKRELVRSECSSVSSDVVDMNRKVAKNSLFNRTKENSSQNDMRTSENNFNHYTDDLVTSGVDILSNKLDLEKELTRSEAGSAMKTKKLSLIRRKKLNVDNMDDTSTGLRLSKSMDISRGSKKMNKIKFLNKIYSTDGSDNIDNGMLCREGQLINKNDLQNLETVSTDVQTVASLLKSYLRQLPEPLVPHQCYEVVMTIVTRQMNIEREVGLLKLKEVLKERLPADNFNLLKNLCCFLHEVALSASSNRMDSTNLAKIFCHSIVAPELNDPDLLLLTSVNRTTVARELIDNCSFIFNDNFNSTTRTNTGGTSPNAIKKNVISDGVKDLYLSSTVPKLNKTDCNRFSNFSFRDLNTGVSPLWKLDLDFNDYSLEDGVVYKRGRDYSNSGRIDRRLNSGTNTGSNDAKASNLKKSRSSIDLFDATTLEADHLSPTSPSSYKLSPTNQLKYDFLSCNNKIGVTSIKRNRLDCSLLYNATLPDKFRNEATLPQNLVVYSKLNREENSLNKSESTRFITDANRLSGSSSFASAVEDINDDCDAMKAANQDLNNLSKHLLIQRCIFLQETVIERNKEIEKLREDLSKCEGLLAMSRLDAELKNCERVEKKDEEQIELKDKERVESEER